MRKIELLAPAGSVEALQAAVQNGADAVYLGGPGFHARAYAANFDMEGLAEAIAYAHVRGVRVYITVNTLTKDSEMAELLDYVGQLQAIRADAVIIQDLGVFAAVRAAFPDLELHCSTQMTLHNRWGVEQLMAMGARRVVLAREMAVEEIKAIQEATGAELEVFVHGALCFSYSGQCLMSSFIGGRSGNRGRCAQPCRRAYEIVSLEESIVTDQGSTAPGLPELYYLSMRDLNTLEQIGQLVEAGVTSFKIEGRMKRPEYVAGVVAAYRRALDHYLETGQVLSDEKQQRELAQLFNRKFTEGYAFHSPQHQLVNSEKPNNRGLFLGTISQALSNGRFEINLQEDLALGDGIEVWQGTHSDLGGLISQIRLKGEPVKAARRGQTVQLEIRGKAKTGDRVYKTMDKGLLEDLRRSFEKGAENKKISLFGRIEIKLNHPLSLTLCDQEGNQAAVYSETLPEVAQRVALTAERVEENLRKLGNTPFELKQLEISLESGLSVPIALLNGLRREAVQQLSEQRALGKPVNPFFEAFSLPAREIRVVEPLAIDYLSLREQPPVNPPAITVKVDRLVQLEAVLNQTAQPVAKIYYGDPHTLEQALGASGKRQVPLFFRSSNISDDQAVEQLVARLESLKPAGLLAGEPGLIKALSPDWAGKTITDYTIPLMNSHSMAVAAGWEVAGVTLPLELEMKGIKQLQVSPGLETEAVIYGRIPLMTTAYCIQQQEGSCNRRCEGCQAGGIPYVYASGLKDQKQMVFPYGKDAWGKTVILNSQVLLMIDKLEAFTGFRVNTLRAEFTDEAPEEIQAILELISRHAVQVFEGRPVQTGELPRRLQQQWTRGHYYRGVE